MLIYLLIFFIISIITIYSAKSILPEHLKNIYIKQIIMYLLCFLIFFKFKSNDIINKNIVLLYIIGVVSLIGLLLLATPINNARCWFNIPFFGTIQPSEFVKIIIVIFIANVLSKSNNKFFKVFLILLIPAILTFLQPDTGLVIIYTISVLGILFCYSSKYKYIIISGFAIGLIISFIFLLYYQNQELMIKIFGDSMFLRIERLINWQNQTGYQLNNALTAMGSTGININFNDINVYYPEAHTDFIFASFASSFGFILSVFLLIIFICFDLYLLNIATKTKNTRDKLIIIGFFSILLYQQFQNIGMTLGLVPITGITLPFISYGGSSLLSYTIMLAIIRNISKKES